MPPLEDVPTSLLTAMLVEEFNSANSNAINAEIAQLVKSLLVIPAKIEFLANAINNTIKQPTHAKIAQPVNWLILMEDVLALLLPAMPMEEFNSANSNAINAETAQQAKSLLVTPAKIKLLAHVINNTTKPLTHVPTAQLVN